MTLFPAIQEFLSVRGEHYKTPLKAGPLEGLMESYKQQGQAARASFTGLVADFLRLNPGVEADRTSQWMNQGQILRPHFWAYLRAGTAVSDPTFALRLYGDSSDYGVSVEVSFMERKKDDHSLIKQNQVLTVPIEPPLYYFAQIDGISQRFEGTEVNRQKLIQQVTEGTVRKVLVKEDINLSQAEDLSVILEKLQEAKERLLPFYEATRNERKGKWEAI
ncbi:ribonuclease P [Streptococcus sp. DD13]|uniref:ribonuclease P n=1 Tax=Streptococcus sp. DD13 TaxID=1777881 RepID=UPI00079AF4E3|nr:ribonuclease P [Streptococcus sp. DD13]KXT77693.1 Sakacin A production response regulator [Streptococcus sp. DD13]